MKKGIFYMLIATFAFAWMNLLAKYLSNMHYLQVVFFRVLGTFIFIFPYMLYKKVSIVGNHPGWLSLRGLLSFLSLAMFFYVIQRIPLGSAVSLRYTAPIFSVLFALWFLKEKVRLWQWIAFLISLVGAFVMKGVDLRIDSLSFALILVSSVLVGGVFTLVRFLASREHYLTIINYFMMFSLIGSLVSIHLWRWPVGEEWLWISSIGIFGLIGQIFLTKAFQMAETNIVAPLKYVELVYALLLGFILFGETYSFMALAGMGILVFGLLLNIYVKSQDR